MLYKYTYNIPNTIKYTYNIPNTIQIYNTMCLKLCKYTYNIPNTILKDEVHKVSYYTFTDAVRGVVSSVGKSGCDLFLVESLSCENVCLKNLSLVTNHPIMVRIAEGTKETINPPT